MNINRLILQLFFVIFFITSCNSKKEKIQPTVENISESVYASGIVKSKNQYQVFASVNGIIKKILVTEGDVVKKGNPLVIILNESTRLNADNARLAADYSALNANMDKLNELRVNLDLAKSKVANDSLLMVRQQSLWSQQIGTRIDLEQKELAYKNSKTAYEAATYRYNDLKKQLQFAASQSQKNVEISKSLEDDYIIKSDIDGKVYSVLKENGEMVTAQNPVAVIGSADEFITELQVDEYDIAKIRMGQKVLLSFDSYKGHIFEAAISKINPIMNERSRSFTVEATFVTKPAVLYPFLTTEANIVIQTKQKALTIPRNYLIDDSLVLTGNNEKRKVVTGLKDYQKVEILSGLSATDYILKPAQ
ncbi:HlyD family efflux transporter periplasmic adaptor subunit [Panacibacter ginsenosidivorans]|uniref:HlyD family efflux transporter periplasmic adaptor subunit n=1 Tax=Panacibacter ginsenosidivorans TaxID=1813871 RepID=A0A5B8VEW4_9BACT|nr:HlyD family efflux transporter periplasmic adaptor subunit [Panacibacter ginsenosidivorans]QEC70034.1 HlyD family efflux transporter periplasmic adaptor subunit [Panacibacter ginsenosidivorans]